MLLKKIELTNFMSVKHAVVNLDNQGLVLVQGDNQDSSEYRSNGSGKSVVCSDGIMYALFEKNSRDLSPNECINEHVGKNMCVNLDFIGDDGHSYRIARHRKDGEFKNDTLVFQDKHNITAKSNRDTNALIEKIIQMDYSTFTNSILFGQGIMKTFSMATDAEKKEVLDKILKLGIWSDALSEAKSELKANKDELVDVDYKIENKGNLIDSKRSYLESLKEKSIKEKERIKQEIDDLEKNIEELEQSQKNKLDRLNKQLVDAQGKLDSLVQDDHLSKIKELKSSISENHDKLFSLKATEDELEKVKAKIINTLTEVRAYEYKNKDLKKQFNDIKSGIGSKCPACGQDITQDGVKGSLNHIVKLGTSNKKMLVDLKNKKDQLEDNRDSLEDKLSVKDVLKEKNQELSEAVYRLEEQDRSSKKQKYLIIDDIESIKERIKESKQHKEIDRTKKMLERRKHELDNSSYEDLFNSTKEEIKQLESDRNSIKIKKADLLADKKNLEFAVEAFGNSGIKSYILDSVTPYLNKQANYYLGKLTGGTTEVEFTTQTKLANGEYRDKFNVKIDNHIGGSSYKKNSRGERKRVDLAISLALQDLVMSRSNSKFNFLLYDECFEGLDDIGCENVMELLQEMQKKIPTIFVITHNDTLKSYFEHTLLVTKKNEETTVKKID